LGREETAGGKTRSGGDDDCNKSKGQTENGARKEDAKSENEGSMGEKEIGSHGFK